MKKNIRRYTRTSGSRVMFLVDCPGVLSPEFGEQTFEGKWFLAMKNHVGTHGVQAEFVDGEWKPLGWIPVNKELSVYKKQDVYAYSVSGEITLDTKDGRISYKNKSGGYVVSNDEQFTDVWYMNTNEFKENYSVIEEVEYI